MKSIYRVFLLILFLPSLCHATHIRGGEILASNVSGQTYKITVRLYLDTLNGASGAAAQQAVTVCFGDGNTRDLQRTGSDIAVPGSSNIVVADYVGTYTYGSSGIFQISTSLNNRVGNLLNLPTSQNTPVFLWTVISTQQANSTPVLPFLAFEAGVRQVFSVDLKPTVTDADSVNVKVYRASRPSPGSCAVRMQDHTYMFPNEISSKGTFKVDAASKKLIWRAPEVVGEYLFALLVEEFRDGAIISQGYREGVIVVTDKPGPTVDVPPYENAETESSEFGNPVTSTPNVDSPEVSMAIEAYPVPSEDFVTVKAYSKTRAIIKLQLIDLNGRVIRETSTPSPQISVQQQFDMRNLSRGMYLIKASNSIDAISHKIVH